MPRITQLNRTQGIAAASGEVRRNPAAATLVGRAGVDLAEAGASAARSVGNLVKRQDEAEATSWVSSTSAEGQKEWRAYLDKARAEAPPGAPNFTPQLMEDYKAWTEETLAQAPNDEARDLGQRRFDALGVSLFNDALTFENTARRVDRSRGFEKGIENLETAAFLDPSSFGQIVQQAAGDLAAADATWMLPGDAATYDNLPGRIAEASMRGIIAKDARLAQEMLEPDAVGEAMTAALPLDRRLVLKNAADAAVADLDRADRQDEADRAADLSAARDVKMAELDLAVSRGQAGYGEIDAAYANGTISPAEYTRLTKQVDKKTADNLERQGEIARAAISMTEGAVPLDPKNTDDRKAVNAYFDDKIAPQLQGLPPDESFSQLTSFVKRSGMVPEGVQGMVRGALRAGNTPTKAAAADFLARLQEANPQAINDFAAQDVTLGLAIASNLRAGVDPGPAVQLAEDTLSQDPMKADAVAQIRRDTNQTEANSQYLTVKSGQQVSLFADNPTVPVEMESQFNRLQGDYFAQHLDLETSQELAWSAMSRVWAVSEVGATERRWMAYAPEHYGPPQLSRSENSEWMQQQLLENVGELGAFDPEAGDLAERIAVSADHVTRRQASSGDMPSYVVMLRDPTSGGFLPIFTDGGARLRWRPDWQQSPQYKKRVAEQKKNNAETLSGAAAQKTFLEENVQPPKPQPGAGGAPLIPSPWKDPAR